MKPADRVAVRALDCYHRLLSPLLPPACRFYPTCSEYAQQAIRRYGIRRGGWMAIRRLASCPPFHEGGFDPLR
jgi:putative membrane protein insertion efficiency factor